MKMLISLALFASTLLIGCDSNNSMVAGEERSPGAGSFAITPATRALETGDQTAVFEVVGGQEPMTWSISDPSLGTLPDTDGRTVTYTRTPDREGTNIIEIRDSNGNRAQARVIHETLFISPPAANLPVGTESTTFTITGGAEPFSWSVSNSRAGTLASTRGRSNVYLRGLNQSNVVNTVTVRDANGDITQAVVQQ